MTAALGGARWSAAAFPVAWTTGEPVRMRLPTKPLIFSLATVALLPVASPAQEITEAVQRTLSALSTGDSRAVRTEYAPGARTFVVVGELRELGVDEWLALVGGVDWRAQDIQTRVLGRTAVTTAQVDGSITLATGVVRGPFVYSESRVRDGASWRILQQGLAAIEVVAESPPEAPAPPPGVTPVVPTAPTPAPAAEALVTSAPADTPTPARPAMADAYPARRIEGQLEFDGRVDDPAWNAIEPLTAVMHFPTFMAPLTEPTEFRVAYDDEYIYFSCKAYDSDPEGIRAYSYERDETSFRSDFCSVYFDTLNDDENALQFKTGPLGNRSDSQRFNDGQQSDNSWNAFWDAAVSRDERGWYAEIRIPFASLLYQSDEGRVVMGVSMLRNISRKNERHVYPDIPPDQGQSAYTMPSLMRKIVFEGIEAPGTPLYVTPYALGGGGYTHALAASGTAYDRNDDRVTEGGLDVRVGLTSNLTLDLTANTDFAQVEADDQQVNLTRFSLFFPEKRRFFQERAPNFEFGIGGQDRLFHSRTVGLARGRPVRIYGGGRVVGRIGDWDVGLLNLQTAESEALPSENLGVARLRRRVFNANSYVGGIFTSRVAAGGYHNLVYGVDGIFRIAGDDYLALNWAQSFDDTEIPPPGGTTDALDRGVARLNWERRGLDGLTYALDLSRTGWNFDPGMGFLRQRDYSRGSANLGYGWRMAPGSRFYTYNLGLNGGLVRRNEDGVVEVVQVEPSLALQTWGTHQLTLSAPFSYENLDALFRLPESTSVPAGEYHYLAGRAQYSGPQGDPFRATIAVEAGQFYDGRRATVSFGPIWDPSAHLNLSATYRLDRVQFDGRSQGFTGHLARLRAQVMLSNTTSAVGFVQYNSTDNAVIANLRIGYNPREGNDFYIVWNEGLVTDRTSFAPVRPLYNERTILVKYSHTFQMGL
ncbi:MAG: hypothetical protein FJ207_11520 [Gemmatimonadetes bacterium]|nr:hypothetical protein [Gemmatimonadota bacterium]